MIAYYNDNDPKACAWLHSLMQSGLIMNGDIDDRSIVDVKPEELKGYARCHFFAGIGGWDYALQLAGWPASEPVWTASLPCQPFSTAGAKQCQADDRHLWPVFFNLVTQCRPAIIFGEQVASGNGRRWLSGIQNDLEEAEYSTAAVNLGASSVGAPHPRPRLWWVGERQTTATRTIDGWECEDCGQPVHGGCGCDHGERQCDRCGEWTYPFVVDYADGCIHCGLAWLDDASSERRRKRIARCKDAANAAGSGEDVWSGYYRGCADGYSRRVPPGVPLLANGVPNRMELMRGYGNAIVPQVAAEFITAYMEATHDIT